jgi:hypothetical protein
VYWIFNPFGRKQYVVEDITEPEAKFAKADVYVRENRALTEGQLELIAIGEHEVGVVYKDGKLSTILSPGSRQVYWKGPVAVRVELVDIGAEMVVPEPLMRALAQPVSTSLLREAAAAIVQREVPAASVGLLFVNGRFVRTLEPGVHGFWKFQRSVQVEVMDLRQQAIEVSGQEILTRDKVSLRANLAASYRVVDPVAATYAPGRLQGDAVSRAAVRLAPGDRHAPAGRAARQQGRARHLGVRVRVGQAGRLRHRARQRGHQGPDPAG